MQCQKCGHPQADGNLECEKCGVIFAKLLNAGLPPGKTAAASDRYAPPDLFAAAEDKPPASLISLLAALLVIAGALWWLNFPSGRSASDATHVNKEKGFALRPPEKWLALTAGNYEDILKPYQDRFPAEWRKMIAQAKFEIAFVQIPEKEGQYSPSLNIIAMPLKGSLPPLTESEREVATKAISGELGKAISTYQLSGSRITEVDKIKSLEIVGTASMRFVLSPAVPIYSERGAFGFRQVIGQTEAVIHELELKSVQTFVPGRRFGYVVSCNFEQSDPGDAEATCRRTLDSFRVADRPSRFGNITMGALNGGLIAAGLYLLWMVIGRPGTRRD